MYDLLGESKAAHEIYKNAVDPRQRAVQHTVAVDRGIVWPKALQLLKDAESKKAQDDKKAEKNKPPRNGFYKYVAQWLSPKFHDIDLSCVRITNLTHDNRNLTSGLIVLALQRLDNKNHFHVCKPHIGHDPGFLTSYDIR